MTHKEKYEKTNLKGSMKEMTDKGLMYISTPEEIASIIKTIPQGKVMTVKEIAEILSYKTGQVYTVLRVALTGVTVTPGGSVEMADILGKDESLRRLKLSKEWLA